MNYEWDDTKRAKNIITHGVDFKIINRFDWATSLTVYDDRYDEPRYAALGRVENRLHFVGYTIRHTSIRIITMRKANRREVQRYETHLSN